VTEIEARREREPGGLQQGRARALLTHGDRPRRPLRGLTESAAPSPVQVGCAPRVPAPEATCAPGLGRNREAERTRRDPAWTPGGPWGPGKGLGWRLQVALQEALGKGPRGVQGGRGVPGGRCWRSPVIQEGGFGEGSGVRIGGSAHLPSPTRPPPAPARLLTWNARLLSAGPGSASSAPRMAAAAEAKGSGRGR
jgi:hypothetical protein